MSNNYNLSDVLVSPIISEKSTIYAEKEKRIVFKVAKSATKSQITQAVESFFKVEVESVNVLNVKGKKKRFGRHLGERSGWRKAYVKLKPGYDINFSNP